MRPTFVVFKSFPSFPLWLPLICLLGCLISLGTGSLEAQDDVQDNVETTLIFSDVGTITPGQTFNLDLTIEGKFNLAGWETGILFNPDILELVSVEEGDLLKNALFQPGAIDNGAGSITGLSSTLLGKGEASTPGKLVTLNFKARQEGKSFVRLDSTNLGDTEAKPIPVSIIDTEITVEEVTVPGPPEEAGEVEPEVPPAGDADVVGDPAETSNDNTTVEESGPLAEESDIESETVVESPEMPPVSAEPQAPAEAGEAEPKMPPVGETDVVADPAETSEDNTTAKESEPSAEVDFAETPPVDTPTITLTTSVLVIEGKVYLEKGGMEASPGQIVKVANISSNISQEGKVDTKSRYNVMLSDSLQPVAQSGDQLEITVTDSAGETYQKTHDLTNSEIELGKVSLDLETDLPVKTGVLKVSGQVYLQDGTSSVGEGVTVSVAINSLVEHTPTTSDGHYTVELGNGTVAVAATNDTVMVTTSLNDQTYGSVKQVLLMEEVLAGKLADLNLISELQQPVEMVNTGEPDAPPIFSEMVQFKDPNLEQALRDQITGNALTLGTPIPGAKLARYHLSQLTRLNAVDLGIVDLSGLEYCTGLYELNLSLNQITDISTISQMATLTHLSIAGNLVSDISPLADLESLTFLSINGNRIEDLSPLSKLTRLTNLYCSNNQVIDISALANLTQLQTLALTANRNPQTGRSLSDIRPMTKLKQMRTLKLGNNQISDISALNRMANLTSLRLPYNQITDITALSTLNQLRRLDLSHNRVSEITVLANIPGVTEWLDLTGNQIRSIKPLLDSLERARGQPIPADGVHVLGKVWLHQNPLDNVSATYLLSQLKTSRVEVFYDALVPFDIIPILNPMIETRLRAALELSLGSGQGRAVPFQPDPLTRSNTISLTTLDLSNAGLVEIDLDFFKGFPNLKHLLLADNPLSANTILVQIPELEEAGIEVDLGTVQIGQVSIQASETEILASPKAKTLLTITVTDIDGAPVESALVRLKADRGDVDPHATNNSKGIYTATYKSVNSPGEAIVTAQVSGYPLVDANRPVDGVIKLLLTEMSVSAEKSILAASGPKQVQTGEPVHLFIKLLSNDGFVLQDRPVRIGVTPAKGVSIDSYRQTNQYGRTTVSVTSAIPGTKVVNAFSNDLQLQSEISIEFTGEAIELPKEEAETVEVSLTKSELLADGISTLGMTITVLDADGEGLPDRELQLTLESCRSEQLTSSPAFTSLTALACTGVPGKVGEQTQDGMLSQVRNNFDGSYHVTYTAGTQPTTIRISAMTSNQKLATAVVKLNPLSDNQVRVTEDINDLSSNPSITNKTNQLSLNSVSEIYETQIFQQQIYITNGSNIVGWSLDIDYDATMLEVVSVEEGDFLRQSSANTLFQPGLIDSIEGQVTDIGTTALTTEVASGNGVVAVVTFKATSTGSSRLSGITTTRLSRVKLMDITGAEIEVAVEALANQTVQVLAADPCDVNLDGTVDIFDLVLVVQQLKQTEFENPRLDVNFDDIIDLLDLILVGQCFDQPKGAPAILAINEPVILSKPELAFQLIGMIDGWIHEAQQMAVNPIVKAVGFEGGILILQRIKEQLRPSETVLLANYPNPFNPETWIPYRLSQPGDVTIMIYNAGGRLIRRLGLGPQPAGYYEHKGQAAYWNGKTEAGEIAASGTYFYTIKTDHYHQTRKMLVLK
jgi:Leucine-rich repeat (LRR) protein